MPGTELTFRPAAPSDFLPRLPSLTRGCFILPEAQPYGQPGLFSHLTPMRAAPAGLPSQHDRPARTTWPGPTAPRGRLPSQPRSALLTAGPDLSRKPKPDCFSFLLNILRWSRFHCEQSQTLAVAWSPLLSGPRRLPDPASRLVPRPPCGSSTLSGVAHPRGVRVPGCVAGAPGPDISVALPRLPRLPPGDCWGPLRGGPSDTLAPFSRLPVQPRAHLLHGTQYLGASPADRDCDAITDASVAMKAHGSRASWWRWVW